MKILKYTYPKNKIRPQIIGFFIRKGVKQYKNAKEFSDKYNNFYSEMYCCLRSESDQKDYIN